MTVQVLSLFLLLSFPSSGWSFSLAFSFGEKAMLVACLLPETLSTTPVKLQTATAIPTTTTSTLITQQVLLHLQTLLLATFNSNQTSTSITQQVLLHLQTL